MRPIDKIFYGYLTVSGLLILLFGTDLETFPYHIIARIAAGLAVWILIKLHQKYDNKISSFFREIYPVLLFATMYEELKWVKFMILPYYLDPQAAKLEQAIFGFQPALVFFKKFHWKIFAEYMYFSYFFYYLSIPFVAIAFWCQKRYKLLRRYVFTVALTFYFFYILFFFLPTGGPRLYFPEVIGLKLNGYLFASLMNYIYSVAETGTAAFPSSHVGVALIVMIFSIKYIRWFRIPAVIVITSLFFATVYGRFHYAIDVLAAFIIGYFFYLFAPKLLDKLKDKKSLTRKKEK